MTTESSASDQVRMDQGDQIKVEVQDVDEDDVDAVIGWARGICRGVTVEEAGLLLGVAPTMDAVVHSLTGSLNEAVREVAAEACEDELQRSVS